MNNTSQHIDIYIESLRNALVYVGSDAFGTALFLSFTVAFLESFFVTTLFFPGCLMSLGLGVLLALKLINPAGCILGIIFGMWIGGQLSYFLTLRLGNLYMNTRSVHFISKNFSAIVSHPAKTLLVSHLCPYLSGLVPAAAGIAQMPYSSFLVYDLLGVLLGTIWFLGIGACIGIGLMSNVYSQGLIAGVGTTVLVVVVFNFISKAIYRSYRNRGVAFVIFGIIEYPIFLIHGFRYRTICPIKKNVLNSLQNEIINNAVPCDILLVTREISGPWGKFSHAALFLSNTDIIHACNRVQVQSVNDIPLRDGFKLLRVNISQEQKQIVLNFAKKQLGKQFRITTSLRQVEATNPKYFSCATFVWAAFRSAGINLAEHVTVANRWVFPRDFLTSPFTKEISINGDFKTPTSKESK